MSAVDKVIEIRCGGEAFVPLDELHHFQGKFKSITEDNFFKLKESIKKSGIPLGFHVWKDSAGKQWVLDGHHRRLALLALEREGYMVPALPVSYVQAKDRAEAARTVLISNSKYSRVDENSISDFIIDFELAVDDLEFLDIPELDMSAFEHESSSSSGGGGHTDPDEVPELKDPPKSKLGDVFILGNHRLMCGDSTDPESVARLMNGEHVDMVFTDPPFGINEDGDRSKRGGVAKGNNLKSFIDDSIQYAVDAFNICQSLDIKYQVWFGANYYAHHIPQTNNWLVWDKRVEEQNLDTNSDCELAWVKDGHKSVRIFRHLWKGMIKASEHGEGRVHPTQKPMALAEWCFERYGSPSVVMDLFGGSGSTLIACEKTNRRCLAMDIDNHYIDVIIQRWQAFTGQTAYREDGVAYGEIES